MALTGGEFAHQVVLITGGSRGIGWAAATRFLAEGARVAVWALHPESAAAARAASHGAIWADAVDVADPDAVTAGYARVAEALGPPSILVNNAGYTLTSRFLEETREYWEQVIGTNLWGVIHCCRAALPAMVERGGGAVVNVVSDAGRVGMAGEAVYAAAKGGVIALSRSLAQEMARHRIRINCVSPGPTRTHILEVNSQDPDAQRLIDKMIQRIPLRRVAEPEEVAEAILFFASPRASHITGQVLSVSGGLTMV
ncbi:MAG: SDR family oxidoreductase [Firmicutes bacterium]|nr:SDR family oxidoreductase [Alicyclobacillaceae bacterium]MCL6497464.1 SDR family oxidoreductase [Bacillota bacterium]